jgi:hypothetical protein
MMIFRIHLVNVAPSMIADSCMASGIPWMYVSSKKTGRKPNAIWAGITPNRVLDRPVLSP